MTEIWGHMPDGRAVHRVTLTGGGLTAQVLTYGAVLQDLRLVGHDTPLVLGFAEFAPYLQNAAYFGTIVGRVANRIRNGHLELDGQTYQLDTNNHDRHTLHGGSEGLHRLVWEIQDVAPDRVSLRVEQPDGHMGFPGKLTVWVDCALLDNGTLDLQIRAETDKTTLCSVAQHSYFVLDDQDSISDHLLQVAADCVTQTDDESVVTGEVLPVAGTRFDFREARPIGMGAPIDRNYCVSDKRVALRRVATCQSPVSGVQMHCLTTEPGLQVYDGVAISPDSLGLRGRRMGPHAGLALEPQVWPDAHHHKDFPQAVLRPGETYHQHTQFVFSKGQT